MEPLEQRRLLATDLALGGFYADGYDLLVDYEVNGDDAGPFDVHIYSSPDGVTSESLLATAHIRKLEQRQPGTHTASIRPEFTHVPEDYFLLAVLDAKSKVTEEDAAMTEEILPGVTELIIGEISEIFVWGVGTGSTELMLLLVPIPDDPLAGERPLSDIVVVNVFA